MSNVIALKLPERQDATLRRARLIAGFAHDRRAPDDVFWLKENAELLGILAATGNRPDARALAPYELFYDRIEERMRFFPQYYRFLLSLCLDLEDLGMPGNTGAQLAQWVADEGLAEAELSDLQRAEAWRLLSRRGIGSPDPTLAARLHDFIARSATFALPNKKAAYELTHIVFYLSEYGTRDPGLDDAALTSLRYAGLLAYLDQNTDLLAEVCTALRFAGQTPSEAWEQAVAATHRAARLVESPQGTLADSYHEYLVTGWAMTVAGVGAFETDVPAGHLRVVRGQARKGALRAISECMCELGARRSDDWRAMRPHVLTYLGPDQHEVLHSAERSAPEFEDFFACFARAGTI